MSKLWILLGVISGLAALAIFLDQVLRFDVWWEWDEFLHHETFIGMFLTAALVFTTVARVEKRRRR